MRPREGGQAEGARVAGAPVGGCRQAASHAGATLAFRAATKPARASFLDAPCRAGPASMTGSDTCPRRFAPPMALVRLPASRLRQRSRKLLKPPRL